MVDFKLTISEKTGKSYQTVINEPDSKTFIGKSIGDKIKGEIINLTGYELLITGGSDSSGFPMRRDVRGSARKKILAVSGVGLKKKEKGIKQRKTVCGNTVHANISQINLNVVKAGSKKLADVFGSKEGEKKEEKAPEKETKEEKKEEKKPEAKEAPKEQKPEETPKKEEPKQEEPKEENKPEQKEEKK
ncbi:30S ribosomal protein S6e [Candidatus Woesearchaeota archaeon]|nr:30S ribosomal protein S6e [Candidatus Woesearchaeota archaeon]|tara:strand:+ start:1509 stop:2075 length:567 start_codon:yes stop_codon:yes gene_type:complete